jgi:virulence-associated protein VagC
LGLGECRNGVPPWFLIEALSRWDPDRSPGSYPLQLIAKLDAEMVGDGLGNCNLILVTLGACPRTKDSSFLASLSSSRCFQVSEGVDRKRRCGMMPKHMPYKSLAYANEGEMSTERHVKLFKNGRNKAVRIPREFEFPGEDAVMRKEGDRFIIEPLPLSPSWLYWRSWCRRTRISHPCLHQHYRRRGIALWGGQKTLATALGPVGSGAWGA